MDRLSDGINIGVADIFFYEQNSDIPIYLGITKEGVTFKDEVQWHELTSDQTGKTPLDDIKIGEIVVAEVKILDTSKRKIAMLMPASSIVGSVDNPSAVTFGQRPGLRASKSFGKLRIHPLSMGGDTSKDVIIYRTTNTGSLELAFKLEEEWVIPCKFKAYYDDFRQPGDQLYRIGDDSGGGEEHRRVTLFWITPSNPKVKVGETVQFRANALYEDGSQDDVTAECIWSSSSTDKVTLSGTNVRTATAVVAGSVVINANYIGYTCSTSMTVTSS